MTRSISSLLFVSLLAALPAAAQTQRPSISTIDAAQKRMNAAICAKADADGDTYRPFSCEPRCDCLAPLLLLAPLSSCEETAPGVFGIQFAGPPAECLNGFCNSLGPQPIIPCHAGGVCASGSQCVSSCFGTACVSSCRTPCASSAVCPAIPGPAAQLSGVSAPDSPNVAECLYDLDGNPFNGVTLLKINSNDALECIEQAEAATGPCQ
jgi:hypothetical protein